MEGTEVRRWRRFGHDRLYVTVVEELIGHRDLTTGEDHPKAPEHAAALAAACDTWLANDQPNPGGRVAEAESEPPKGGRVASASERIETPEPTDPPWDDLSRNAPGQGVREEAIAEWAKRKEEKPIRAVLGRVLDVHNDERAWRMGAIGEEAVGRRLEKYAEKDPRWHFLHAVPVGSKGSDLTRATGVCQFGSMSRA